MSRESGLAERLWTGAGLACVVAALLLSSAGLRVTPHVAAGTVASQAPRVAGSPSASPPALVPDGPAAPGSRLVLRRTPVPPPCD